MAIRKSFNSPLEKQTQGARRSLTMRRATTKTLILRAGGISGGPHQPGAKDKTMGRASVDGVYGVRC